MTAVTAGPTSTEPTVTMSELVALSGATPSAVRFYEKHGLVVSARTPGHQRRFHQAESCIIKIIRVAQRVGLSVSEIRELMADLPPRPEITIDDWFGLRGRLEDEVRERIRALNEVLDDLTTEPRLCEVPPGR